MGVELLLTLVTPYGPSPTPDPCPPVHSAPINPQGILLLVALAPPIPSAWDCPVRPFVTIMHPSPLPTQFVPPQVEAGPVSKVRRLASSLGALLTVLTEMLATVVAPPPLRAVSPRGPRLLPSSPHPHCT